MNTYQKVRLAGAVLAALGGFTGSLLTNVIGLLIMFGAMLYHTDNLDKRLSALEGDKDE